MQRRYRNSQTLVNTPSDNENMKVYAHAKEPDKLNSVIYTALKYLVSGITDYSS